jgi:hypothetical protein
MPCCHEEKELVVAWESANTSMGLSLALQKATAATMVLEG